MGIAEEDKPIRPGSLKELACVMQGLLKLVMKKIFGFINLERVLYTFYIVVTLQWGF